MSMTGRRALQLERARQEALRLEQVRGEARGLLSACEAAMTGVRDAAVQQLAATELGRLVVALQEERTRISEAPELALKRIQLLQQSLAYALTKAQAQAQAWSEAQLQTRARLDVVAGRIEAVASTGERAPTVELETARRQVAEARTHAGRGADQDARRCLDQAEQSLDSARAAGLEEKQRRELVRGLLATLKELGFIVTGPRLSEDLVILEGMLPSGRQARFEVKVDGQLSFDLDGYEGRTCAEDLEKVETAMRDRFGVTMGPPQVEWKNPDRLSRGALDLPGGSRSRSGR